MNMDEGLKRVRREKLLLLLQDFQKEKEFAARVGIEPSYLSRIKGKQGIGDGMARMIETAFNKPSGWMDIPAELQQENAEYQPPQQVISEEEKRLLENYRALCPDQRVALKTVSDALAQSAPAKKAG